MADLEGDVSRNTRLDVSGRRVEMPIRWSGIWAGVLIALGVLVVLTSFGMAVGVRAPETARLGAGAAWWAGVSFLIALFIGGAVSARSVTGALSSVIQGACTWVLSMLAVFSLSAAGVWLGARQLFAAFGSPVLYERALAQLQAGVAQVGTTGTMGTVEPSVMSAASWVTFIVIVLSLIAAVIGALVTRQDATRA